MPFDATPLSNDLIVKLQQIHDLIDTKGWTQHAYRNNKGYCLLGAAREVKLDRMKFVKALGVKRTRQVYQWNDRVKRTKSEVLERIKDAIEKERERLLAQ